MKIKLLAPYPLRGRTLGIGSVLKMSTGAAQKLIDDGLAESSDDALYLAPDSSEETDEEQSDEPSYLERLNAISGIGESTARDIIDIYPSVDDLIDAVDDPDNELEFNTKVNNLLIDNFKTE